ncbi:MAG: hypothetical protein RTV31_05350 [Candidatus Thorarchaeota archaeon]
MVLNAGLVVSLIIIVCTIPVAIKDFKMYNQMRSDFFRYFGSFYFTLSIWMSSYFIQILFLDTLFESHLPTVIPWLLGASWVCMGFLIASGEFAKKNPNRSVIRFIFIFVGIGVGFSYEPSFLSVQVTELGVLISEGLPIVIVRIALIIIGVIVLAPMLIGIVRMLNKDPKRYSRIRYLFIVYVGSGVVSILLFMNAMKSPVGSGALFYASAFTIVFLASGWYILHKHPTLFLAARHDLVDLIIVEKDSGLPVFRYNFDGVESGIQPEIVTAFVTSARIALRVAIPTSSEAEHFHFGESSATMNEGLFVYGIILSRTSSDLLASLLRLVIEEFEISYWFKADTSDGVYEFDEFREVIERYFEFDLYPTLLPD